METYTFTKEIREPFASIDELTREWVLDILETVEDFADVYGARIDTVEAHSRDGFIAFTAGGYDGKGYATLGYAHGSGAAPKAVQPYLDRAVEECRKEWDDQNPTHTRAWIYATGEEQSGQTTFLEPSREREYWREKYWEFQDGYFEESGTYFYKVRAIYNDSSTGVRSDSGEPEIMFCVGINTDFDYGRDSIPWLVFYGGKSQKTEWAWERVVKVADLEPKLLAKMAKQAKEALRDA